MTSSIVVMDPIGTAHRAAASPGESGAGDSGVAATTVGISPVAPDGGASIGTGGGEGVVSSVETVANGVPVAIGRFVDGCGTGDEPAGR